jgi:hypothetical protein
LVQCCEDGSLLVAVFGNDRYTIDSRVAREVELVREWLTAAGALELGFGVSPDGDAWAMLLRIENHRYHTPAGQEFFGELVRAEVEEEVDRAWRAACGADRAPAVVRRMRPRRRAG